MRKIHELAGTVLDHDLPVFSFEYSGGKLIKLEILTALPDALPSSLWASGNVTQEMVDYFFNERVPPMEQESFTEICNLNKVSTLGLDGILRITRGKWIEDDCWIKFQGEEITWSDVSGYNK